LRPFFRDHPGEPVAEENFWTLWCKGRLTEADTLTIRMGVTPSGLVTSAHLHHTPTENINRISQIQCDIVMVGCLSSRADLCLKWRILPLFCQLVQTCVSSGGYCRSPQTTSAKCFQTTGFARRIPTRRTIGEQFFGDIFLPGVGLRGKVIRTVLCCVVYDSCAQ